MAEHSVIIWDLETVPDLRAAARMAGIDEEETETARESMGSGFPKVIADCHKVPGSIWDLGKTMAGHALKSKAG